MSEARGHLEQGDLEAAAKSAERSLKKEPTSEAYYIIGHRDLVNDQYTEAAERFRSAIKLDDRNADAVFELGLALDELGEPKQAIEQFQRFTEIRPEDPKGTIQEAYILFAKQDRTKQAKALLDECLVRHPDNTVALYYAALCANDLGDRAAGYAFVDKALDIDPEDVDFPYLKGRWLCQDGRYAEAEPLLARAKELAPEGKYKRYWAWARCMAATDTALWEQEDGDVRLTAPWRNDLAAMDSLAGIAGGRYDRSRLLPRFLADEPLTLDELIMLYYSQSLQEDYTPYSDDMDELLKGPQEDKKWDKVMELTEKHLKEDPLCLDALSARANACRRMEAPCYDHATMGYELLMMAITATGSGNSFDDAVLVMSVEDEYTYIAYNGLRSSGQSLHNQGRYSYDVLQCTDGDGKKRTIHFNITKPFGSLGKMFKDK